MLRFVGPHVFYSLMFHDFMTRNIQTPCCVALKTRKFMRDTTPRLGVPKATCICGFPVVRLFSRDQLARYFLVELDIVGTIIGES